MTTNHITLTDEIIESAIEMAPYGIAYWCSIQKWTPTSITIRFEDPKTNEVRKVEINAALLQAGADIIVNNPRFAPGIPHLLNALIDDSDMDSDAGDALVQAALFGEITFG